MHKFKKDMTKWALSQTLPINRWIANFILYLYDGNILFTHIWHIEQGITRNITNRNHHKIIIVVIVTDIQN